jgi:hypothetical protein
MTVMVEIYKRRLAQYEKEVSTGIEPLREALKAIASVSERMKMALPALNALKKIKDEWLFKPMTWEQYLKEKWEIEFSETHVNRLIQWATIAEKVRKDNPDAQIPNESQARELSGLSEEQMSEAWENVSKDGNPTAKRIKEEAAKLTVETISQMPAQQQKEHIEGNQQEAVKLYHQHEVEDEASELLPKLAVLVKKVRHEAFSRALKDAAIRIASEANLVLPDWALEKVMAG